MVENKNITEQVLFSKLLTAKQVEEILNIGRSTTYQLIQSGELPSVRIGRAVRVRIKDLERFISKNLTGSDDL